MAMARDEVTQVAKQEALDQENTAFIVQGEATTDKPVNVSPQIRVKVCGSSSINLFFLMNL